MSVCGNKLMSADASRDQKHLAPRAGVTGSCELSDVGAQNHIWVLWREVCALNH